MPSFLSYIFRSPLAPQHVWAMAIVLALLAAVVYARNMRRQPTISLFLLAMRWAVIAALTTLLMGPSELPPAGPASVKPPLHIYLDSSASMLTPDVRGQSRIAFALKHWLSDEQLAKLREHFDVQLFTFDANAAPLSTSELKSTPEQLAAGTTSLIAENLTQAVLDLSASGPGAAMLVLSDGHDSQGQSLAQIAAVARSRSTVIHAVALGGKTAQQDLSLGATLSQRFLMAKEPGTISVRIRQTGFDQAVSQLRIEQGATRSTQPITFNGEREVEVTLPIQHDMPGVYEYKLTIDPAAGEVEVGNNTRTLFAEVTGERIKVLLLEGEPYWDTKYLAQSLRKDASVQLTHITQMTASKQSKIITRGSEDAVASVPTTAQDLAKYNVVILGRGLENVMSIEQAQLLPAFVNEQGGHLILARGKPYSTTSAQGMALAKAWSVLEPVTWNGSGELIEDVSWKLTPAGEGESCFAFDSLGHSAPRALSVLRAYSAMESVDRVKPAAQILAYAVPHGAAASAPTGSSAMPALVRMQVGSGHVVAILGEGLWQWSQLPPKFKQYDGMYDLFWSNLVRSLAMGSRFQPNQDVSLELSTTNARLADPVTITVITRIMPRDFDYAPKITVTDPAGKQHEPAVRKLTGGTRYQATYKPAQTGVHQVQLDASPLKPSPQERKFSVYYEDIERLESSADPDGMRTLAEQSGGSFFTPDEAAELPAQLARSLAAQIKPNQPEYVWNQGFVLALLLIWTGLEWLARRGVGLL